MTIKPSWRTKAMYTLVSFALIFGLVATVLTIAPQPSAKAGTPPPVEKAELGSAFDPDFEGTPRVCETVEGCCVTFTNLTTGGVLPYQNASWDFCDGSLPVVGQAINYGETIEHCYTDCGTYTVTLTMWDGNSTETHHVELDYITVTTMIPIYSWGEVTLDGTLAPEGTTVEIFVGDDTTPSGSGDVAISGQYGVIPICADDSRYGEELHYTVNGFPADKQGPDPGVFGAENQVVNLAAYTYELAIRQLPECEQREQTFEVCITFNATDEDFNSIGLVDGVPPGWAIQVDTAWCSPNADSANIEGNHAQYAWNGPYPASASFIACYQVTVPLDAVFDTYTFSGELGYEIAGGDPIFMPIDGDSAVEVGDCITSILVTGMIREIDCDILPDVEIWLDGTGPVFSAGNGTYEIYAPETGTYNISANKGGFRERIRTEYIEGPDPVNLNFQAASGLIPCSPDVWYTLECVNLWLYPPGTECDLDMDTVLDVINAWLYPGCP